MVEELWKPVWQFEGIYEVSNLGRVRNVSTGLIRKVQNHSSGGYLSIKLEAGKRAPVSKLLHHVVLEAWKGPRPEGAECRHLNGIPSDCTEDNLVWGTSSENKLDSVAHGTHSSKQQRKLTEDQVREIRSSNLSIGHFEKKFLIGKETIRNIRIGRTYRDVI